MQQQNDRGTGRTKRQLVGILWDLISAEPSACVVYVCHSAAMRDYAMRMAADFNLVNARVHPITKKIEVAGRTVLFRVADPTLERTLQGLRATVVFDHAVSDHTPWCILGPIRARAEYMNDRYKGKK